MKPLMSPAEAKTYIATLTEEDFVTVEEVHDEDGNLVTDEDVQDLIDAAHAIMDARKGRPSLTASGGRSPQVTTRLPQALNAKLDATARSTHRRRSQVVRDALEAYLVPA